MTNYIIEGGLDFNAELQKNDDDSPTLKCLLTGENLEYNNIKLACGHNFNYKPLFKEIIAQKTPRLINTFVLQINEIRCPYCRNINAKILPYIPLPECKHRYKGINSPLIYTMPGHRCEWIFKSGKKKNTPCHKAAYQHQFGTHCPSHAKQQTIVASQPEYTYMKVVELRDVLRQKGLRVGGRKQELIDRIHASQ